METNKQQQFQRYAQPSSLTTIQNENNPLSFKAWYGTHTGILPGQEYSQYNEYLLNWYKQKKVQTDDFKLQQQISYLTLLKQLQLFFSNEEVENWYNQVDVNDEKELLLAIPYFAKKLRDISLYYIQLRDEIKKTKLKYNLAGTDTSIVLQLKEQLLKTFTKNTNTPITISSSILRNVPDLSSVKDTFTLQIEELYDDHEYFDQSPTLPVSAYYDITDPAVEAYFASKNLALTATDWIYKTGSIDITDSVIIDNIDYTTELLEKYISSDKYTTQTTLSVGANYDFYTQEIQSGNNFFYWPNGAYKTSTLGDTVYEPVPLSASGLEDVATAGETIQAADTIFVKTPTKTEGAWYRYQKYDITDQNMVAYINGNTKTIFKFPFPGFGLSADDTSWSGPSLTYTSQFFYLDDTIKQSIENEYWSLDASLTSVDLLPINSISCRTKESYASDQYLLADKIRVWPTPASFSDGLYSGEINEAWLYRVNRTDIPVASAENSVILWPYQRINPEEDFPNHLLNNISNTCQTAALSNLGLQGSTCSNHISSSDVIYRIQNYKNTTTDAVEAAWLSGDSFKFNSYSGTIQTGLNGVFQPGTITKFVWNGIDNTNIEEVFKTYSHQPDCNFVRTASADYTTPDLCTCKQNLFTPFGHPGPSYTDNSQLGDFIVEDNFSPNEFILNDWRDNTQKTYLTSPSFGWYKTTKTIGWGNGRWYTGAPGNSTSKFYLKKGKAYAYYRANTKYQTTSLPALVVRYTYPNTRSVWMKAIKTPDGTWVNSGSSSSMNINPGDLILYSKTKSSSYTLTGSYISFNPINENRGSIWAINDYISVGKDNLGNEQKVYISYPTTEYANAATLNAKDPYQQYPDPPAQFLYVKAWTLTDPLNNTYTFSADSFSFVPTITSNQGIYRIQVVAAVGSSASPSYYTFNNIPPITAVSPMTVVTATTGYDLPAPGFVINEKLYGWDYNTNTASAITYGIMPFWAKSYTSKDAYTAYKGVDSWGQPFKVIDGHNIIVQPDFSDIQFKSGNYIEYDRKYPSSFIWTQPLKVYSQVDKKVWSVLQTSTSTSNLQSTLRNVQTELISIPSTEPSPIKLRNFVSNEPAEIHYNAINSFTWPITATPVIFKTFYDSTSAELKYISKRPWNTLANRYFPTIALYPSVEDLYTESQVGGFFKPQNLGASVYTNQDYTATLSTSSALLTSYFEDVKKFVAGRGLTKTDQPTPYYDIMDDNTWLKEPTVSGPIAGNIKKNVAKKYQKFIPYQSAYESNSKIQAGLVLPTSRQSPWGGLYDTEWTDTANKPENFAGVINVDAWSETQVLKQNNKQLDNWATDIFGNQYGLYKSIKNINVYDRKSVYGELWTRKNSQSVQPACQSLSAVFDSYRTCLQYNELTGTGIKKIDVFFDTLFIETSGLAIFEKISYDFDTDTISSIVDEARFLSLVMPVSASIARELSNISLSSYTFAKLGETWFFPQEKYITVSVCGLSGNLLSPALYSLNLNNRLFQKIFPVITDDTNTINNLSALNLTSIQPPVLSYDDLKKTYTLALLGLNSLNQNVLIEFIINNLANTTLRDVNVYTQTTLPNNGLPPTITHTLSTAVSAGVTFSYQVTANNNPTSYTLTTDAPSWLTVSSSGLFTGVAPASGIFYAPFSVSNDTGPIYYSLLISSL